MNTNKQDFDNKDARFSLKNIPIWLWVIVTTLAFIAILLFVNKLRYMNRISQADSYSIARGDVIESVELAGRVEALSRADIGFDAAGTVKEVFVSTGDSVKKGDVIGRLDAGSLYAQLQGAKASLTQAQINSTLSQVDLSTSENIFDTTQQEQEISVDAAYAQLLNTDLQAYSTNRNDTKTPPIISGSFDSLTEGEYLINVYRSAAPSGYSYTLSGLEVGRYTAHTTTPEKMGERGLYAQFASGQNYNDTQWIISIPNKRSEMYTSSLNAYEQAQARAKSAVTGVRDSLVRVQKSQSPSSNLSKAQVSQARSQVNSVGAQIGDYTLRAPFDGIIASLDLEVGEIVPFGQAVASIVSDDGFKLVLNAPEIDVARLAVKDVVSVTLDAYSQDDQNIWEGEVDFISPLESYVDGVPVYKTDVRININEGDERVRSGMSARARLGTDEVYNVLTIPQYLVGEYEYDFQDTTKIQKYVYVRDSKKSSHILISPIEVGIVGTDGLAEITSGLIEGQEVVAGEVLKKRHIKKFLKNLEKEIRTNFLVNN